MSELADRIKERLGTVRDVLEDHHIEVKGKKARCINPAHEDRHPSMSLYDGDEKFKCHSCGIGGDCIAAWAYCNGYENDEAVRELAQRVGFNGQPGTGTKRKRKNRKPKTELEKSIEKTPATAQALGIAPPVGPLGRELNFEWVEYEDQEGETKRRRVPRPYHETVERLQQMAQAQLFRVNELVFAIPPEPGGEVRHLKGAPDFFGWLGEQAKTVIEWESIRGAATKAEAFSALAPHFIPYDGIETVPHHPEMIGLYYNVPPLPEPDQGAFDELLDAFNPETEHDGALIAAMFLTTRPQ